MDEIMPMNQIVLILKNETERKQINIERLLPVLWYIACIIICIISDEETAHKTEPVDIAATSFVLHFQLNMELDISWINTQEVARRKAKAAHGNPHFY